MFVFCILNKSNKNVLYKILSKKRTKKPIDFSTWRHGKWGERFLETSCVQDNDENKVFSNKRKR